MKKQKCKWCEQELKKIPHEEVTYEGEVFVVCENCGEQTIVYNKIQSIPQE